MKSPKERMLSPEQRDIRLRAARHLRDANISCVVWFEDAVAHYQVPTGLFDLYLLVPDINTACQVLQQHGFSMIPQAKGRIGNAFVCSPQLRLACPDRPAKTHGWLPSAVVLLPAALWAYDLDRHDKLLHLRDQVDALYPVLPHLVDAFIDGMLDFEENALREPLGLHLSYLYQYTPELRGRKFANQLREDNRQFHNDIISGMMLGTLAVIVHEREVRNQLRTGLRSVSDCSTSAEDEPWLFFSSSRGPPHVLQKIVSLM
jgi:hypothetical protein